MTSTKTEKKAVGKIAELIDQCDLLESGFGENDKTRFTDGHIDIFHGPSNRKHEFEGRVDVQIKGRKLKRNAARNQSFQIKIVDLIGFQALNGVLFFVVNIDETSGKTYPKYVLLSPFAIQRLLSKAKPSQGKISVQLKPLPKVPNKLTSIVQLAHTMRQERVVDQEQKYLFDNMLSITVHSSEPFDSSSYVRFRRSELDYTVLIRTTDGIEEFVDVELDLIPSEMTFQTSDLSISSGGIVFPDILKRRTESGGIQFRLSEGLQIDFVTGGQALQGKLQISYQDGLASRLKDLEFLFALKETGQIAINGHYTKFALNDIGEIQEFERQLESLRMFSDIAIHFGVDREIIRLSDLTDLQIRQIEVLHDAVIHGKEVRQDFPHRGMLLQPIGRWNLALIAEDGNAEGEWRITGITDPGFVFAVKGKDKSSRNELIRVTPYDLIPEGQLATVLNLRPSRIVEEYASIENKEWETTYRLANRSVLNFILAADQEPVRRLEFLQLAMRLNQWLLELDPASPIERLNRWQILHRDVGLSEIDKVQIRELRYACQLDLRPDHEEIMLGCALLLDDYDEAKFLFGRLSPGNKEMFFEWPISNLLPNPEI